MITQKNSKKRSLYYQDKLYHCFYTGTTLDIKDLKVYDRAGKQYKKLENCTTFTGHLMATIMRNSHGATKTA